MQKQKTAKQRVAARDKARTKTRLKKVGAEVNKYLAEKKRKQTVVGKRPAKKAPPTMTPLNKKK